MNEKLHSWLTHPGSFMERLKEHGVSDARIEVIGEKWLHPAADEAALLNLPEDALAWIREVVIFDEKNTYMYARTIIPSQTLTGKLRQLQQLNSQSLGSLLFKLPEMKRSEFEFMTIKPESAWHRKISQNTDLAAVEIDGRRSLFSMKKKQLLLTEFYLPGVLELR